MKTKKLIFSVVVTMLFVSCASEEHENNAKVEKMQQSIDSLKAESTKKDNIISQLKDSIEVLSYPASQRLEKASKLIDEGNIEMAENELLDLKKIFPHSIEASNCDVLFEKITKIKEEKKAEEERIKALGFKALKQSSTIEIGYNKITLSSISIGNQFVFDAYDDRWFYRDADRGNKYITMAMSVTSTSKNPKIPEFAVYRIDGDEMKKEGVFTTEYARWSDYGSYLGNYHDSQNDFSKVSTVKFKLGCEVEEDFTKQPFAIIVKKQNVLTEEYDRFKNPPKYWVGSASYPYSLKLASFDVDYAVIKIFNFN